MVSSVESKKSYLRDVLKEKLIRRCRADPCQFIQYVMSWGIRNWIPLGTLHMKWQSALTHGGQRVLFVCPRDHAKTTLVPIGRVLWELGRNPNLRVKIVCQSDDTAVKRLSAIIEHIERNPRIAEIFPNLKPAEGSTWSKTRIYLERDIISPDPSVEALGILSTAVGGRADLLVFDDPVDFRNTIQQPALRDLVIETYLNVWMNIVEPDGRVWYISTPWSERDLTHYLMKDETYTKVIDRIDDNFTPIWPEKWNRERLIAKCKEIGNRAFARAFKMVALSDEETLFSIEMLQKCEDKMLKYGDLPKKQGVRYAMGVDLGSGRTESGSYSVIFTGAIVNNKKVPVNIVRGRFRSPEFARIFYDTFMKYKPELIYVENNAVQEAIVQWIEEVYGNEIYLPVRGYFTGMQKWSETVGLPAMSVEFEQGNWVLPSMDHMVNCACGYCVWIRELTNFPLGQYNDTVMASWLFREAVRSLGRFEARIRCLRVGE